mgnify:CR=1 FL=1
MKQTLLLFFGLLLSISTKGTVTSSIISELGVTSVIPAAPAVPAEAQSLEGVRGWAVQSNTKYFIPEGVTYDGSNLGLMGDEFYVQGTLDLGNHWGAYAWTGSDQTPAKIYVLPGGTLNYNTDLPVQFNLYNYGELNCNNFSKELYIDQTTGALYNWGDLDLGNDINFRANRADVYIGGDVHCKEFKIQKDAKCYVAGDLILDTDLKVEGTLVVQGAVEAPNILLEAYTKFADGCKVITSGVFKVGDKVGADAWINYLYSGEVYACTTSKIHLADGSMIEVAGIYMDENNNNNAIVILEGENAKAVVKANIIANNEGDGVTQRLWSFCVENPETDSKLALDAEKFYFIDDNHNLINELAKTNLILNQNVFVADEDLANFSMEPTLCAPGYNGHGLLIDSICYILNKQDRSAKVIPIYGGYIGKIEIPSTISYNGIIYSVTSIGEEAFCDCVNLTAIEIPYSITSICKTAFWGCSSLTSIVVAEDNSIYDSRENSNAIIQTESNTLIVGCQNTKIPESVTSIGDDAFGGCSNLTLVTIPESVTSIGGYAFQLCTSLQSLNIPNSVETIDECAISLCDNLKSVTLPNNIKSINLGTFWGDYKLENIIIPDNVETIGAYAFDSCCSLTKIIIPQKVRNIEMAAFLRCYKLDSVTLPNSLKTIGDYAFYDCSSLTDIYCYAENIPETGSYVFYNVPTTATLHVLSTSVDEYKKTYPWSSFSNIVEIPNEIKYSENGIKYTLFYNSHQATVMPSGLSIYSGHVVIPETVIYEGEEYTVTAIENSAFYEIWGSLESVSLPKSITAIGEDAFKDCEDLKLIIHSAEPPATESAIVVDSLEVPKGSTVAYARATSWNGSKHIYATEEGVEYYPVLVEVDSINCLMVNGEAAKDMEVEGGLPVNLSLDGGLENTAVLVMQGGIEITEQMLQGDTCTFEPSAKYAENVLEVCAYPAKEVTLAKSGTLISQIGAANVNDVYSLKLVGDINGTDIRSILRLQNLRLLDLNEANIVEGGLAYYDSYTTTNNYVGRCFFKDMALLKRVTFPASAVYIQARAFEGCTSLRTVTIPEQMNEIDISAFDDCAQLTCMKIENGDDPLKIYCEDYDDDDDIWHNLHNSPLVALYMGRNIAYIEGYYTSTTPFTWHKETLRTVTIGKRVTEITGSFFYGCTGLKSVTIGSHVKAIGGYAFSACPSLKDIYSFNATPPEIQATTFDAETEQQATLHVPVGSVDLYWLYPYWENFFNIKENPAAQIAEVRSDAPKVVKGIYTLDGRKCNTRDTSTLPRGIYIVDGKKLLVK